MIYRDININTNSDIIDYLASLSDQIVKVSDTEVSMYDKFHLSLTWSGTSLTSKIFRNDAQVYADTTGYDRVSNPALHLLVYISDEVVFIRMNRNQYNDRFVSMTFIHHSEGDFAGLLYTDKAPNLYNMSCVSFDLPATTYYFAKILDFTPPAGSAAVVSGAPLTDKTSSTIWVSSLVSCATVPFGSTITLSGYNYFAIGTNTLMPLPEEIVD